MNLVMIMFIKNADYSKWFEVVQINEQDQKIQDTVRLFKFEFSELSSRIQMHWKFQFEKLFKVLDPNFEFQTFQSETIRLEGSPMTITKWNTHLNNSSVPEWFA